MTNRPPENDILKAWRIQPTEPLTMSLQQLRSEAGKFEKSIKRRNLMEYIAAVLVMAGAGWFAVILENTLLRTGCVLIVAGVLYVVRQLYRRGSAGTLPSDASLLVSVDFYLWELVRQRDLLRSVWSWYIGPLLPGMALLYIGVLVQRPDRAVDIGLNALLVALFLVFVGAINWRAAAKLQREVDEIDALKNGGSSC